MTDKNKTAVESRAIVADIETRASEDGKKTIYGYAAVFNSPADIGGMWVETIAPGAFTESIGGDVFALYAHDSDDVLGRTKSGSLRLSEDAHGLKFELDPPDTQLARDLMVLIERGDVTGMSIGFVARKDIWDETVEPPQRTLAVVDLREISITAFPAYPTTEVGVRSLDKWRAEKAPERKHACVTAAKLRMRHALRERSL